MSNPPAAVVDVASESSFIINLDALEAELVYEVEPGQLIVIHTEVPDALSGRGIGGQLIRAAIDRARADNLTLVPWCPFARG